MYKISQKEFKQTNFVEKLNSLVRDVDPNVVINAIQALNEVLENWGGIDVDSKLVIYLLNWIKDFNEWGQSIVLELVSDFNPTDRNLIFDIMNLLESRLKHASSSVLLGAVKVFLNITKGDTFL